jgi:hypothetical protein
MTKAITGFLAVGVGFSPVATRTARTTREHSEKMAAQCNQMGERVGGRGAEVGRT